jgi:hypothetical protein
LGELSERAQLDIRGDAGLAPCSYITCTRTPTHRMHWIRHSEIRRALADTNVTSAPEDATASYCGIPPLPYTTYTVLATMESSPPLSIPLLTLHHVSRVCKSVDATRAFYKHILGFYEVKRPSQFDFEGSWCAWLASALHKLCYSRASDTAVRDTRHSTNAT